MGAFKKLINATGFFCLVTLSACSESVPDGQAADASTTSPGVVSEPIDGEQLLAQPPAGWKQGFATKRPALRMAEYIAEGDNPDDWQEKVVFESLSGDSLPDPIDFVVGIATDQSEKCERFEHFNIQSGLENSYPTSVRLLTCSLNKITKKGHVTLIKAIQGNDNFYVITRVRRIPPVAEGAEFINEADMAAWAAYMRTITVCDSERDDHPCP